MHSVVFVGSFTSAAVNTYQKLDEFKLKNWFGLFPDLPLLGIQSYLVLSGGTKCFFMLISFVACPHVVHKSECPY